MMNKFRKSLLIGVTAMGLGAGSLAVHAAGMDHGPGMGHRPMSAEDRAKFEQQRNERMAKHQAELHDKLKLTPAQEPAWNTFVQRMRPANPPARPDPAELAKLSAPERMERGLEMMKQREKVMADRLAAVKEFYGQLTPEQQKVFNDEFARGRHHRAHS